MRRIPQVDQKNETAPEASVLDWVKSLLRGRPIPIPTDAPTAPKDGVPAHQPAQAGPLLPQLTGGDQHKTALENAVENLGHTLGISSMKRAIRFVAIEQRWRGVAMLLAAIFTMVVLFRLPRMEPQDNYSSLFLSWLLAIGLYGAAIAWPSDHEAQRSTWLRRSGRWAPWAVGAIVLVALGLRVWLLGDIPFTLSGDEASQGLEAMRTIWGGSRNPFGTGWFAMPTMGFFFNSLSLRITGATIGGLRIPWSLMGVSTVLLATLMVGQRFGPRLGLATGALLATYHYHIHYSRLGSSQIADPFFASLSLFFLFRALRGGRSLDWILVGAVNALALYFYIGARFVPLLTGVVFLFYLFRDGQVSWRRHWPKALIALGAFAVVAAPMIQLAVREPYVFNARINQVAIFQSGWLEREIPIRGESAAAILWDQFLRASMAFNFYPDRTVWYGLPGPLLGPFFGALFLLGLGYATLRVLSPGGDTRFFPMVAWWWGGMILGGMLTESPPSSQRLVTLVVPVCFFIALAIWRLVVLARRAIRGFPRDAVLVLAVLTFGLTSVKTYFLDYTPLRISGGQRAEMATELAPMLNQWKHDHDFFFVGAPYMHWGFATLPYLVPDAQAEDILEPITTPPPVTMVPDDRGAVFIFVPERFVESELVEETFPGGERIWIRRSGQGTVLGLVYRLPQGSTGWNDGLHQAAVIPNTGE